LPTPSGEAVVTDALGFADLVARARGLVVPGRRALLGVVGSPGAGKSTLTEALLAALRADPPPGEGRDWVAHVPMDGYHLADVELERLGLRDAKGAPDTFDAGGYVALLARLRAWEGGAVDPADPIVYAPAFERTLEQPLAGAIPVPAAARLVLTEGNYLLLDTGRWPAVRPLLDEVWFCTLDDTVRAERLLARHVLFGKPPAAAAAWVASVDEPNAALIEATRDRADLLVPSSVLEAIGAPPDAGQRRHAQ
jgi:pantothenate kinase